MDEKMNAHRIFVRNSDGKAQLGSPGRRWVGNIKMDLGETG
jgi:hypothetical protein